MSNPTDPEPSPEAKPSRNPSRKPIRQIAEEAAAESRRRWAETERELKREARRAAKRLKRNPEATSPTVHEKEAEIEEENKASPVPNWFSNPTFIFGAVAAVTLFIALRRPTILPILVPSANPPVPPQ